MSPQRPYPSNAERMAHEIYDLQTEIENLKSELAKAKELNKLLQSNFDEICNQGVFDTMAPGVVSL